MGQNLAMLIVMRSRSLVGRVNIKVHVVSHALNNLLDLLCESFTDTSVLGRHDSEKLLELKCRYEKRFSGGVRINNGWAKNAFIVRV
jgi:hypothetical protein